MDLWTGNHDANELTALPKPRVLKVSEWDHTLSLVDTRTIRAELMTFVPGEPCSPTDVLRHEVDLPRQWWTDLRRSLDHLAGAPTTRTSLDQAEVTERVRAALGNGTEPPVHHWETVHGDLHWSTLFRPRLAILDWKWWGRGPAGTDVASLYCHSVLTPATAATVHEVFADILDTPDGRAAQLRVAARLLTRAEAGEHADLTTPLRELVAAVRDSST